MPIYSSDSDDQPPVKVKLFDREKPLHHLLGGGKMADVILWRNKNLSAAILGIVTIIWFLFEVVEYHFVTLFGHACIISMLLVFIWCNGATLLDRTPPKIPEVILSEEAFKEVALIFHAKFSHFVSVLYKIARGEDFKLFLVAISSLWILSVIGSYCNSLSLLYLGLLCIQTVPALYERYEQDVDYLVGKGGRDLKKFYRKLDLEVLNKIPRGPVKEKKSK